MSDTFYRLHSNPSAPCFCAEHAWSGLWGGEWNEDGSATHCNRCGGTGTLLFGEECTTCDGDGWEPALHGYSACWDAAELAEYMDEHGVVADNDPVVIFEGRQVGTGFDGEPLAVPTGKVRWITWKELKELALKEEAVA